jgi:hypothetical protein
VVSLSTLAITADGWLTTDGMTVVVDNKAPTGLTVGFPRKDGYIGQGGELAVDASDNMEVSGSELVVGGRVVSSKDLAGGGNLDLPWTVKVPNGRTAMTVRVRDIAGNVTALTRTVTVDNKAPAVSIVKAPKNRAKVKKKFTVTARASDTYGIARVQLLVNGKVVKTDTAAGYSFTVNPKKYGKKFTVRIRAYDKAGNVTYSSTRTYKR